MDTSKIIKGVVGGGRYTVTAPIIKEDYGLYLKIEGLELPSTYEVDFSNSEHNGTSVTMIGNSDGVLIPNQFISSGKDVFAFLYHVGDNYGRTVFKFRIPNKLRPDRTDEQPTPEEQSVIDQAISALNSAVEQTAQDVIDADQSAQDSASSAQDSASSALSASDSAERASASATNASQSASQASASATASAQSASQSAQIKADVEGMVDEAQGYASASAQSASASANSASQASGYAQSASQSASSAQGYASQAQTSAQTASSKATEASGYASTASAKATESAQSATNAQGYAQTAEQAKTSAQTAQGLAESARDDAIDAKTDAESARDTAQSLVDGISEKVEQIDANTADIASLEEDIFKPYATDSASGSIASFADGADDIPLKSLIVNIDPVQDLSHGDPSPENICPISGWTQVDVEQTGKNLFDQSDTTYLAQDVRSYGASDSRALAQINTLPAGTYTLSFTEKIVNLNGIEPTETRFGLYLRATSGGHTFNVNAQSSLIIPTVGQIITKSVTFTLTDEYVGKFQYFYVYTGKNDSVSAPNEYTANIYDVQIELGSTATDYEPYTGRSITIDLGQTVYGGKLDVLTGILTVYPECDSYNGETLTGRWISDRDVYASGTTPTIGAQVVNVGAEGTEYQLSPTEVKSILGTNNIFADTGDTACEYRADTTLYIQRLTEPDADMIADSNIVSGQYFMVGNSLYKATANIASGAAVIVGTNAIRKSLSEALNEINS